MTSSITYGIITLTKDGVTLSLQLLGVQNERTNTRFSLNKFVQDGAIVIDYEGFVHISNLFVC